MSGEAEEQEETKEPSGKILYRHLDRAQMAIVMRDWESLLTLDHPARAIWELAGRLDWSELEKAILSREQTGGRPVWEPRLLASVWMYAHTLGVGSARAVERMQGYEPWLQWLRQERPSTKIQAAAGKQSMHRRKTLPVCGFCTVCRIVCRKP